MAPVKRPPVKGKTLTVASLQKELDAFKSLVRDVIIDMGDEGDSEVRDLLDVLGLELPTLRYRSRFLVEIKVDAIDEDDAEMKAEAILDRLLRPSNDIFDWEHDYSEED